MRDSAGEFDDVYATLHVAARVGDHLAVLGGEEEGELLDILLDQLLIFEHDAGAPLRVGRRPAMLRLHRDLHGLVEVGGGAEAHLRLHGAAIGVEYLAMALAGGMSAADNEMIYVANGTGPCSRDC